MKISSSLTLGLGVDTKGVILCPTTC